MKYQDDSYKIPLHSIVYRACLNNIHLIPSVIAGIAGAWMFVSLIVQVSYTLQVLPSAVITDGLINMTASNITPPSTIGFNIPIFPFFLTGTWFDFVSFFVFSWLIFRFLYSRSYIH